MGFKQDVSVSQEESWTLAGVMFSGGAVSFAVLMFSFFLLSLTNIHNSLKKKTLRTIPTHGWRSSLYNNNPYQ